MDVQGYCYAKHKYVLYVLLTTAYPKYIGI